MTNRIVCRIGGVDYGSAGQNLLMSLDSVSPMGPGGVGTATIGLRKTGGGITITNQMLVELYEQEIGTNKIPRSYVMGIVNRRRTGVMRGTNIKVWAIDTVDANDALDGIVVDAKLGITVASGTFTAQIASLYTQAIAAGTPVVPIDYASGILDPTGGATLPAVTFKGRTLRQMIQDRCNALQSVNTALRMKFHIGPDTNPNRTTFGGPILYTYDAQAAAPFIALWFTDTPGAGKVSIAQAVEFGRIVEGAKLIQKRQVLVKATGGIYTGSSDPAVITTYKYPYSGDGARWGELVEDSQSLTDADGVVAITRAVRSTGTPRETIQLSAYAYALPGQYAKLDWALEGLAGAIYSIAAVSVDFRNWRNPLTTFTLGARRLMLGENPDLDELVMPIERDRIPPAKPANWRESPVSTYSSTTRMSTVNLAFDAPQETDLERVDVIVTINGVQQPIIYLARGILTLALLMAPSATWSAYAIARDTSGNKSDATATLTGTAAAYVAEVPGPPATVTLSGVRTGQDTWQANVSWTAGTGGTGTAATYEVRYYKTASGAGTATILQVPTDNRVMLINGLLLATGYTINVRSVTAYGDRGGWSTGSTLTFSGETPGAPTISGVSSAKQAIIFNIGKPTTGTGLANIDRYIIGMAWYNGATLLGKEERIVSYSGDPTGAAWMGVNEGVTYKFAVTALTKFGDVGTASAQQTYTVTPPPPAPGGVDINGSFEREDPNNPTQPDGWTITVTSGTATTALDSTQVYSGKKALKVVRSGGSAASVKLLSDRFDVFPSDQLFLTGAIYGVKALSACGITPAINFYKSDGTAATGGPIFGITTPPGASAAWGSLRQTAGLPVPATAVQAELQITVDIDTSQTTVYVDNFSVDVAVTPERFVPGLAPIQKGTSNPSGSVNDVLNWRTDIGRGSYYNGTRWATPDVKILPFDNTAAFTAITASNTNVGRLNHNGDLDWLLYRWAASVFIATTNNASNYWTLTLRYITAGNTVTNVSTMTTAALAANTWARIASATFSPATAPVSAFMFEIIATTTGAPGSLLVVPQLLIREIIP